MAAEPRANTEGDADQPTGVQGPRRGGSWAFLGLGGRAGPHIPQL